MTVITQQQAVDFGPYVARATRDFTGREWVFDAVNRWLGEEHRERYFLLTGEPGSGKTAVASRLWQISRNEAPVATDLPMLRTDFLSAAYFCAAPGLGDRRWINPATFATSVALQLAARYTVFATALADQGSGGRVRIDVTQNIDTLTGRAIGVAIERLDVGSLSAEDAFAHLVREPLEILCAHQGDVPVVIVVDALDESLLYTGQITIAQLLSEAECLPDQVRLILTCRPEVDLFDARHVGRAVWMCSMSGADGRERSNTDIRQFVEQAMDAHGSSLGAKLAPDFSRANFVGAAERKSNGNFLYVRRLLDMLASQQAPIGRASFDEFPSGLDGIYAKYLRRVVDETRRNPDAWDNELAPMIGSLAVAQEPLSEVQLASIVGLPADRVRRLRSRLGSLLDFDPMLPPTRRTFTLFHRSFADFVLDPDRAEEFWLDRQQLNRRLVTWCEKDYGIERGTIWLDQPDKPEENARRQYARRHYVSHIGETGDWDHLQRVLDDGTYGKSKVRYDPTGLQYALDLDVARRAAAPTAGSFDDAVSRLGHLWRYSLLRCSLTSLANDCPEDLYVTLALLGREQEAIDLAELVTEPADRAGNLIGIANALATRDPTSPEVRFLVERAHAIALRAHAAKADWGSLQRVAILMARIGSIDHAIAIEHEIGSDDYPVYAMIAVAEAYARANRLDDALSKARSIEGAWGQAEALCAVGRMLAADGRMDAAGSVLAEACGVARSEQPGRSQTDALIAIADALLVTDQAHLCPEILDEALQASQQIQQADIAEWARSRIGHVLARSGRFDEALATVPQITNGDWRALLLKAIAIALTRDGRLEEALPLAAHTGGAYDEINARVQILIAIARCLFDVGQSEAATSVLDDALAVTREADWHGPRVEERSQIARTLVDRGMRDQAASLLDETRALARGIHDTVERVDVRTTIADVLLQAGDVNVANRLIAESLTLATDTPNNWEQAHALTRVVQLLVSVRRVDEAARVARQIRLPELRAESLALVGGLAVRLDKPELVSSIVAEVLANVAPIEDDWRQAESLSSVAVALAAAGSCENALSIALEIRTDWKRDDTLLGVVKGLSDRGQIDDACAVAARIKSSYDRAQALSIAAQASVRAGQVEAALAMVKPLLEGGPNDILMLIELVKPLVAMGHPDAASALLGEAYAVARSTNTPQWRADRLGLIASALMTASQAQAAQSVANESLATLQAVTDPEQWAHAHSDVIKGLRDVGASDAALAHVQHGLTRAGELSGEYRAIVLPGLAEAFAHLGRTEEALATLRQIDDTEVRNQASRDVAIAFAAFAPVEEAIALARRADDGSGRLMTELVTFLVEADRLDDASNAVEYVVHNDGGLDALLALVRAQLAAHSAPGEKTLAMIPNIVGQIREDDMDSRKRALRDASQALAEARRFTDAFTLVRQIDSDQYRLEALQAYATAVAKADDVRATMSLVQSAWLQMATRAELQAVFPMVRSLIVRQPDLGGDFAAAYAWVDDFLTAGAAS